MIALPPFSFPDKALSTLPHHMQGSPGPSTPAPRQARAKPLGRDLRVASTICPETGNCQTLSHVHRRILRTGGAWYKGRWYDQDTASALRNAQPSHNPGCADSTIKPRLHRPQSAHSRNPALPTSHPQHLRIFEFIHGTWAVWEAAYTTKS